MNVEKQMNVGRVITREMIAMLCDESLDDLSVGQLMRAIVCDKSPENKMLASFANSLKSGYVSVNIEYVEKRERRLQTWRNYNRKRNAATTDNQSQPLATTRNHTRQIATTPIITKQRELNNIPLSPKGGKGEEVSVSSDSGETIEDWAARVVVETAEWYPYAVNTTRFGKILMAEARKNSPARVEGGLRAWRESGAWDEARFVPRRIAEWVKAGHYLDEPPQKSPAARAVPRAAAVPDADATARLLADNGEED